MLARPEVWLPVIGYEGVYSVSNLGRVRRDGSGRILRPSLTKKYLHVTLSADNVQVTARVHVLVLTAFCGPPPFEEMEACHNDGYAPNCALINLRWGYSKDNMRDKVHHGRCRGERVYGAVLTEPDVMEIRRRADRGELNPSIADDFGVSISTVHLIRHRQIWRHVPEQA